MNIYHISQTEVIDYDTYSDAVVAAVSEQDAVHIHPSDNWGSPSWCDSPEKVNVKLIGSAVEGIEHGVICANFHGG